MKMTPDQDRKKSSNVRLVEFDNQRAFRSVEDTIEKVLDFNREVGLEDMIVIGYDTDGELFIRSTAMTRAEANFMLDRAKLHSIFGDLEEVE